MISTSIFTKNRVVAHWGALDPAWRSALGTFLVSRLWFVIWPLVILNVIPVVVQNLALFGAPVLAAFDVGSSARYTYARELDGTTLFFRPGTRGTVLDTQTQSVWSLPAGRAESGTYVGRALGASPYTPEDVFPYHGATVETNALLAVWQRFDTNWYLKIAEQGYSSGDGSTVYFPLYPLLIRIVAAFLLNQYLWAALLVANLSLLGVFYLLFKMAEQVVGADAARRALVYLAIFPTAFFLFAGYTESLFLLLALGALYAGERGRWLWAAALGALAALTRLQGVLLIVPLTYLWWQQPEPLRIKVRAGIGLLMIPLATVSFLTATNLTLLTSYEGALHARFVWPWENIFAAVTLSLNGGASLIDVLNLVATMLSGVMCVLAWFRLPRSWALYAIGMLLAPMFRMTTVQPLVSMTRYALVIFPVFVLWGAWGRNAWAQRAILYLSLPINLYLSAQFFLWGWVG